MNEQATYYQKKIRCGQKRCKKCREGNGHGPYWYVRRKEGNRTVDTYIGPSLPPDIQHIGRTHQSPLIGREQELSQLQDCIIRIEQAHKQTSKRKQTDAIRAPIQHVLILEGEAGMGKTRLAEEVARFAVERKWAVLWECSYAQEQAFPYRPWAEVLRKAISQDNWLGQEVSNKPQIYQPLSILLPDLSFSQVPSFTSFSPEQEQLRMWEAIRELLVSLSTMTPLLLVLDDLQWADFASGELLAYLTRHFLNFPVCIVGTYRSNELPSQHPLRRLIADLRQEGSVQMLSVPPLAPDQIRTLVLRQLPLSETLSQRIEDCTAGNPFFAEELVQTIKQEHWADVRSEWTSPLPLPLTVSAVLDQHLHHLSTECLNVLRKASLLGRSFELRLLRVLDADHAEETTVDALEEGLASGLLTEKGVGSRITYHFHHPLLTSHLYEQLSAARRALLHRRVADLLRQEGGREEDEAALITYHLLHGGGDPKLIAQYAEVAANRAFVLCAYPDAEQYYQTAISQLSDAHDTSTCANGQGHLAFLLERLGECAVIQGKTEAAQQHYERALDLREPLADQYQDAQLQALIWTEIGWTWRDRGESAQAMRCSKRAEQILRDASIPGGPAWASLYYQRGSICWQEGHYEEARQHALHSLALFEEFLGTQVRPERPAALTRIQRTCIGDPVDVGRLHLLLAAIYATIGQGQEAELHLKTALSAFDHYDCQREIAIVCCNLGDLYLRHAEYALAQQVLERAVTITERIGDLPNMVVALGNRGILAARRGDFPRAEASYKRALTIATHIDDPLYLSLFYTYLSAAQRESSQFSAAKASLCHALKIGRRIQNLPCLAFALVSLAQYHRTQAIMQNDPLLLQRAKQAIERALAITEIEAETKTEGHLVLAQVLFSLGEAESARHVAQQALELAQHNGLLWLIPHIQETQGHFITMVPTPELLNQE